MATPDRSAGLDRHIALALDAHRRLLAALDELVERDELDVRAPSNLPGWTVGHVLTHVANSGDGHARMFDAAADGRVGEQYPGGRQGRAADIEAGATRPAAEQVRGLRHSIDALEHRWQNSDFEGRGHSIGGFVPIDDLAFLRIRETAVHHIDLDIGYGFDDLPAEYVRLELRRMNMLWTARRPMGMTKLPNPVLAVPPPRRLAWLLGRADIDGLPPAGIL